MKDLIIYIMKNLVNKPDEVGVQFSRKGATLFVEIFVSPEDRVKLFEDKKILRAMKTIIESQGQKVVIKVVE